MATPSLLIVNPNTTAAVTHTLASRAQALAPAGALTTALTARFGAPYISDELSAAVAGHAFVDALASAPARAAQATAVLLGCFGDPGLLAARQVCGVPVVGMAEAAMREAAALGPFAIVTGGLQWPPMLERLAASLDLGGLLACTVAVDRSGAQLAAEPAQARVLLREACVQCLRSPTVRSIVVGGAALGGIAADLGPHLPVPLIDGVDSALRAAWAAAASGATAPMHWPDWWKPA